MLCFRVKAFENVLQHEIVDMGQLQKLAFNGKLLMNKYLVYCTTSVVECYKP